MISTAMGHYARKIFIFFHFFLFKQDGIAGSSEIRNLISTMGVLQRGATYTCRFEEFLYLALKAPVF